MAPMRRFETIAQPVFGRRLDFLWRAQRPFRADLCSHRPASADQTVCVCVCVHPKCTARPCSPAPRTADLYSRSHTTVLSTTGVRELPADEEFVECS